MGHEPARDEDPKRFEMDVPLDLERDVFEDVRADDDVDRPLGKIGRAGVGRIAIVDPPGREDLRQRALFRDGPAVAVLEELKIDAGVRGNAARFVNHSCAPNCETFEDDDGRVYIAARRPIRAGEELSYDYRLEVDGKIGPRLRRAYRCRCGAPRCRGTMLSRAR